MIALESGKFHSRSNGIFFVHTGSHPKVLKNVWMEKISKKEDESMIWGGWLCREKGSLVRQHSP